MKTHNPKVLEMKGICKHFGGVVALDHVDFDLEQDEVHSLVGDNGAGKSTLVKIICGVYEKDEGEIFLGGKAVQIINPRDARARGIEVIHQDLALVDEFDVVSNLFLAKEHRVKLGKYTLPILDVNRMRREAKEIFARVRINIPNFFERVFYLSGGQRQGVAISRAIHSEQGIRVLIMDEPTAALGVQETGKVLDLIHTLKEHGITILVISHNLEEVFAVSDRITVLRTGKKAITVRKSETDKENVVGYIVGAKSAAS